MSSNREPQRLRDIVDYIDRATTFLGGMSVEDLAIDHKSLAAIERCLQCITEAAIKIGDDRMAIIAPDLSMHMIRGLGNRLRHAYDDIDPAVIHRTVSGNLPNLRAWCVAALGRESS